MNKIILIGTFVTATILVAGLLFVVMTNGEIELPTEKKRPEYIEEYDLNNDGIIDQDDVDILIRYYGATGPPGWIPADVNRDGRVDVTDISMLTKYVGAVKEAPTFDHT